MTWVKLDDQFFTRAKAQRAGKDGRALYLAGLCFCAANLTDGVITSDDLPFVAAAADVRQLTYRKLIEVGLWEEHPEGFVVHDYLHYNPPAARVKEQRERDRVRKESARNPRGNPPGQPPGIQTESARPVPLPSPVSHSSSTDPLASEPLDDDELLAQTWHILAERRLAKRESEKGSVGSKQAWLTSVEAGLPRDLGDEARSLLAKESGWTPDSLAAALEPQSPLEATAAAAAKLRAKNALPPCAGCDSTGWVETEDGVIPCEKCERIA